MDSLCFPRFVRVSDGQMCVFVAGAGGAVGRGEAERRSCADLCKQAGPADGGSSLGDRRGTQSAHHPRSDVADPVLLRSHRRGDSGEQEAQSLARHEQ